MLRDAYWPPQHVQRAKASAASVDASLPWPRQRSPQAAKRVPSHLAVRRRHAQQPLPPQLASSSCSSSSCQSASHCRGEETTTRFHRAGSAKLSHHRRLRTSQPASQQPGTASLPAGQQWPARTFWALYQPHTQQGSSRRPAEECAPRRAGSVAGTHVHIDLSCPSGRATLRGSRSTRAEPCFACREWLWVSLCRTSRSMAIKGRLFPRGGWRC